MRNKRAEAMRPIPDDAARVGRRAQRARLLPSTCERKRGIARGPNKIMLAAVGLAALLSIGTPRPWCGLIPSRLRSASR